MAVCDRSWDSLYQQYHDRLLRQVQKYLPARDESQDVLQDLYVQLRHRKIDPADIANPPAFLMRMATNLAIDALRRHNRNPVEFTDPTEISEMDGAGSQSVTPNRSVQIASDLRSSDVRLMICRRAVVRCSCCASAII